MNYYPHKMLTLPKADLEEETNAIGYWKKLAGYTHMTFSYHNLGNIYIFWDIYLQWKDGRPQHYGKVGALKKARYDRWPRSH